jgi:hypothetical protein
MARSTVSLWASCTASLALLWTCSLAAASPGAPLPTEDLGMRIPGRVAAVLWTVREEHCTLQIVFPNSGRIAQARRDDAAVTLQRPRVQVWLLKADGTLIAPDGRLEPGTTAGRMDRRQPYGVEINFVYPLSADKEAVAAAIQVDDAFYVEPLHVTK